MEIKYEEMEEKQLTPKELEDFKQIFIESRQPESKEYFVQELKLRDQEVDMVYDLYCKHRKVKGGLCPAANFSIRYEYTSIGVFRYMIIEGQSFCLTEDIDF